MKLQKMLSLFIVSLFCLAAPTTALAAPAQAPLLDDKVIFQGSFTLESGEVLNGNILVFGGIVKVEEGALIDGDAGVHQ